MDVARIHQSISPFFSAFRRKECRMSNNQRITPPEREQPPPSLEPWLVVCLLALLPAVLIVVLAHERLVSLLVPIIGSIVLLFGIGLVMLWRATRERRG